MRKTKILFLLLFEIVLTACSPRDFLTRRLAEDLISAADAFKAPQQFALQTGVVSNKDYLSPEYLVLQHRGWISAATAPCPQGMVPPPCWDVLPTPSGVEIIRTLFQGQESDRSTFSLPVARREFVSVVGISKQGSTADVEFTWHWVPLNEIGAALYSPDPRYRSTVAFRQYDDGWRVVQSSPHTMQTLDDALKNAEPAP